MHPVLFSLGPLTLHTYGLLVALGLALAIYLAWSQAGRKGINQEAFLDMTVWMTLAGVAGARLFYVLVSWKEFRGDWLGIFRLWDGGLVFYGGLIGAVLAMAGFARKRKLPLLPLLDMVAPYASLAHALGRVGCFFSGCCYGLPNARWGVVFPALGDGVPHLATQLMEGAGNLLLFILLLALGRRRHPAGQIFWFYMGLYALMRFGLEFLRGDEIRGTVFFSWLHTSQMIALLILALAVGMLIRLMRQPSPPR